MNSKLGWYPAARIMSQELYLPLMGTPRQVIKYIDDVEQLLSRFKQRVVTSMTLDEIRVTAMEFRVYDALIQNLRDAIEDFTPPPFGIINMGCYRCGRQREDVYAFSKGGSGGNGVAVVNNEPIQDGLCKRCWWELK